jgi:opacity protein-like surface antigen
MKRFTEVGRTGSHALVVAASALVAVIVGSTGVSAQVPPTPGCTVNFANDTSGFAPFAAQSIGGVVGAANAITSVIGTMNTSFIAQGNAFVAGLPNPKPDETSGGIWGRMIGGTVDTKSTGTFSGSIDSTNLGGGVANGTVGCNSSVRMNYGGFQLGQDIARLNIGGGGSTLHIGVTGGYAEANAQDQGGSNFVGNFEIPFAGVYAAYTNGRFFADILGRADFYQMSLTSAPAGLQNQRLNGLGGTVSASAGYRFDFGNNWFFEPSGSLIYSKVNLDTLNLPGGFGNFNNPFFLSQGTVQFAPNESLLGRVGARVGTTYNALNITWQPFATASVWHEFAGNSTATYATSAGSANGGLLVNPAVTGNLSNSRVGTFGQYSVGVAASASGSPLLGYVRVDYKEGPNIESLGFNAGLRYNFDPTNGLIKRPGIYKATPVAVAYDWTGLYVGAFAGPGWGKSKWNLPATASGANSQIAGALAGGNIGYNKQYGSWVLGVEGDFAATNAKGGQSCVSDPFNPIFAIQTAQNCNNDLKWMATATGKVGYAWDRVLVYGKAGAAWTDNKLDISCNGDANFFNFVLGSGCLTANNINGSAQNLVATLGQFGWTVGAGFELSLTPSWSAKAEYNYLNFGSRDLVLSDTTLVHFKQDFNQVKIGVNYHFGKDDGVAVASTMPVKAKALPVAPYDWTGVYVGAAVADRASVASWETTAVSDGGGGLTPPDPTTTPASFFSSNAQGRLYSGYNWQFSPKWVAGIEGDVGNGDSRMTVAGIPGTYGNGLATAFGTETQQHDSASVKMGWDGTVRGKLGMLVTPTVLFYGTGGVAFQRVSVSATCDGTFDSWCVVPRSQTFSSVRAGWTVGLGIEAVVADKWLAKVEGRYADFGRYNNTFFAGTGIDDVVTTVRVQTFTALAGVAYKFGPTTVVAKY